MDTLAYGYLYAHTNGNIYSHFRTDYDCYADGYTCAHGYSDAKANKDSHVESYLYSHPDTNCDAGTDMDTLADPH